MEITLSVREQSEWNMRSYLTKTFVHSLWMARKCTWKQEARGNKPKWPLFDCADVGSLQVTRDLAAPRLCTQRGLQEADSSPSPSIPCHIKGLHNSIMSRMEQARICISTETLLSFGPICVTPRSKATLFNEIYSNPGLFLPFFCYNITILLVIGTRTKICKIFFPALTPISSVLTIG